MGTRIGDQLRHGADLVVAAVLAERPNGTLGDGVLRVTESAAQGAQQPRIGVEIECRGDEPAQELPLAVVLFGALGRQCREDAGASQRLFEHIGVVLALLDQGHGSPADLDQRALGVLADLPARVTELFEQVLDLDLVLAIVAVDPGDQRRERLVAIGEELADLLQARRQVLRLKRGAGRDQLLVGPILARSRGAEQAGQQGAAGEKGVHASGLLYAAELAGDQFTPDLSNCGCIPDAEGGAGSSGWWNGLGGSRRLARHNVDCLLIPPRAAAVAASPREGQDPGPRFGTKFVHTQPQLSSPGRRILVCVAWALAAATAAPCQLRGRVEVPLGAVAQAQGSVADDPGVAVEMFENPNLDRFLRRAQDFLAREQYASAIEVLQDVIEGRTLEVVGTPPDPAQPSNTQPGTQPNTKPNPAGGEKPNTP